MKSTFMKYQNNFTYILEMPFFTRFVKQQEVDLFPMGVLSGKY